MYIIVSKSMFSLYNPSMAKIQKKGGEGNRED